MGGWGFLQVGVFASRHLSSLLNFQKNCLFLPAGIAFAIQSLRDISAVSRPLCVFISCVFLCFLPWFKTVIVLQRLHYGSPPPQTTLQQEEDLEQALALSEE